MDILGPDLGRLGILVLQHVVDTEADVPVLGERGPDIDFAGRVPLAAVQPPP